MNIDNKLIFNYKFFEHAYEYKNESTILPILIKLYKFKPFIFCLYVIEKILTFLLSLKLPIYSDLILAFVTHLPGLPRLFGCYLRAIYFKGVNKSQEPNVLIEQGVVISNPSKTELQEFAFIDKYVILASHSSKVGRRVHIAPFVIVTGGGDFIIENYACMATGSRAITATETLKSGTRSSGPMVNITQRDIIKGFIHIKKDAFVAVGVTLLTNTIVEEGVVLATNVVVSGKTESWNYYINKDSLGKPIKSKKFKFRKKLDLEDT